MESRSVRQAAECAHTHLLFGLVPLDLVTTSAEQLAQGPLIFSTRDLAVASALAFFINSAFDTVLKPVQSLARDRTLGWAGEGEVSPVLLLVFESALSARPPNPGGPGVFH